MKQIMLCDKGHSCRPLINIQVAVNAIKIMDQMLCKLFLFFCENFTNWKFSEAFRIKKFEI